MHQTAITGSGVFTPNASISNEELVAAFNSYVDKFNLENAKKIESGEVERKEHSSTDFILKASGIENRYVLDKSGILDPEIMRPILRERGDEEPSVMAEMAVDAATKALKAAGRKPEEIDCLIVALWLCRYHISLPVL